MNTHTSPKIRVLVADDNSFVRCGVRMMLACEPDMEVLGEAANGWEAIQLARRLRPGIVLIDPSMDGLNGVQAARQILQERCATKIIAFSNDAETTFVQEAVAAGVLGYLLKNTSLVEVIQAIREVHLGNAWFSPQIAWQLAAVYKRSETERTNRQLSAREAQVLQLVAEGHTNRVIAGDLGITTKTVEKHRLNLMRKLDLHGIAQLVRYAAEHHIIEVSPAISLSPWNPVRP